MKAKKFLKTSFDLCTGCNLCQLACTLKHEGGFNPDLARLDIRRENENLYNQPVVCNHCENPYCAIVCPVGAITITAQDFVVIDRESCIGCGLCSQYCPLNMCRMRKDGKKKKAIKCDFCSGSPECAKACPTGALIIVSAKKEET